MGAAETGLSVYELPPGQAICYHYEYGEDEWLLFSPVARPCARPRARMSSRPGTSSSSRKARRPPGHERRRRAGAGRDVVDDRHPVGEAAYPDSDKIGLWTGIRAENVMVKRSSNVGWEGETLSGKRQLATMITTRVASASSPAATLRTKTQVGSTPT